jgi:2-desacetyl-2-hydroxyethyl bacteriochlorophyllide A dehydrogenase
MRAVQLVAHGMPGRFELKEVPNPKPGPGEVVVEVHACGLNRLDLWFEENALPINPKLPRITGGEVAGRVAEVGSDVTEWPIGTRVAVQSNYFCGTCEFCLRGEESMCLSSYPLGVLKDGGFAEKVVVEARALIRLDDNVTFETAAALTLAGSTAMHMLKARADVRHGDTVLVMGAASGVGSSAIQIAKALGAQVITTGSTEAKRALGRALGAEHAVDSTHKDWPAEVRRLTSKRGVDWIIEHIGGDVLTDALGCLARGGAVITCGATAGREASFNLWSFFVKQQRLIGSYARNRDDLVETLEWAARGKLKAQIDRTYRLEETADAYARLRSRMVLGKVIVRPLA